MTQYVSCYFELLNLLISKMMVRIILINSFYYFRIYIIHVPRNVSFILPTLYCFNFTGNIRRTRLCLFPQANAYFQIKPRPRNFSYYILRFYYLFCYGSDRIFSYYSLVILRNLHVSLRFL